MSEEQGFDLAVQRTSGIPQAGFGATTDGIKAGMLSVAAMVSKSLEVANRDRSFLCAMRAPNGLWIYVAQREGVLLHDGDLLATEEVVRNRMMTDRSLTEWQTVFAPEYWGISDSIERSFEDLLPRHGDKFSFKKWWEVRPVRNPWLDFFQDNLAFYIIIGILAAGLTGYHFWTKYQIQKQLEELARLEAEEQAARAAIKEEQPWKKLPSAAQYAQSCESAIFALKTLWPGNWDPAGLYCKERVLTVKWLRRDTGTLEQILAFEPQVVISPDGNQATLEIPLELGPPQKDDVLPKEQDRRISFLSNAQRYGLELQLKDPQTGTVLGQALTKDESWKGLNWALVNTSLTPSSLIAHLDTNGLRITQIHLSFNESGAMKWSMEGNQYVQP